MKYWNIASKQRNNNENNINFKKLCLNSSSSKRELKAKNKNPKRKYGKDRLIEVSMSYDKNELNTKYNQKIKKKINILL